MELFKILKCDAPSPWQLGFQDSASFNFTGLVELHDDILFYLVFISILVFWILGAIIYNFDSINKTIIHKYLNHGIKNVPMHKYFNNLISFLKQRNLTYYFLQKRQKNFTFKNI